MAKTIPKPDNRAAKRHFVANLTDCHHHVNFKVDLSGINLPNLNKHPVFRHQVDTFFLTNAQIQTC
jgi:hypothetical protein